MENPSDEEQSDPKSVEKYYPVPEEIEKMIIEDPQIWIRVHAVNMSYHNPDYLKATLWSKEDSLKTIVEKLYINKTEGKCFDDCKITGFHNHFEYKY